MIFGDVFHVVPVVLVAHDAGFIYDEEGRHASHFEQADFLVVGVGDGVFRVGKPNEGDGFGFPVALESVGTIGPDAQDFRVTRGKGRVVLAQAGEVCAAVGSHEAARKDQHHMLCAAKIGEADGVAVGVGEGEIGGGGARGQGRAFFEHGTPTQITSKD